MVPRARAIKETKIDIDILVAFVNSTQSLERREMTQNSLVDVGIHCAFGRDTQP